MGVGWADHRPQLCKANSAAQLAQPRRMTRIVATHHPPDSSRGPTHRLMVSVIFSLLLVMVAEQTLGAADPFDGAYSRKQVLTKSSGPGCPTEDDDVSVTIHGEALTFTDSSLRNFSIGINPHQD